MANVETSNTTLSDLHDPPLDAVFDSLPLRKLLLVDEVCSRWKDLKPIALRRRRHLVLVHNQNDLQMLAPGLHSEYNRLRAVLEEKEKETNGSITLNSKLVPLDRHALYIGCSHPIKSATLNRLIELLPNLTVFQLVQEHGFHQELRMVTQLLDHYRQQLVQVTIVFWGVSGRQNQAEVQRSFQKMFTSLMTTLNSMTKLRSLDVNFKAAPGCPVVIDDYQLLQHSLPDVVGRLKTLKFRTCFDINVYQKESDNYDAETRLLKQVLIGMRDKVTAKSVAANSKQEDLELYFFRTPLNLRTLISLGPGPVAAGLRSVEIDGFFSGKSKAEYKALARFARQSAHLQALTVKVKSLSICRLVESLASLKELVTLKIGCLVNSPEGSVNVRQLPVIPSVNFLHLSFTARSHRNYEQLHLETLFPNLQTVEWNHLGFFCLDCGYQVPMDMLFYFQSGQGDVAQFKAIYGRQMSECLRLARMAAFSRLPQFTHLLMSVSPSTVKLPFKDELFTSRLSLDRQTEFITRNGDADKQVVFND